jgi:hypothetical protein
LLDPGQCWKTTLARAYIAEWTPDLPAVYYFDLEDPTDPDRLDDAKLALLIVRGTRKLGFEFKYGSALRMTRSLGRARELLSLDSITVVYPGSRHARLHQRRQRQIGCSACSLGVMKTGL